MPDTIDHPWFAIRTRPRCERMAAEQLQHKGYEPFLPTYVERRRWSDRFKDVECPMFADYLFCRIDRERTTRIVTTPGVLGIVGMARQPVPIDDEEIAALQRVVASRRGVTPWPFLHIGERVRVDAGTLAGLEGMLVDVRGGQRVVVSIRLLQRAVAVELHADAVSPVNPLGGVHWAAQSVRREVM